LKRLSPLGCGFAAAPAAFGWLSTAVIRVILQFSVTSGIVARWRALR
jgi:hypothetical protein